MNEENEQKSPQNISQTKKQRDYLFLFLLLLTFSILFCAFIPGWINANNPPTELPFSLHSVNEADYSREQGRPGIPEISIEIVRDVMRDLHMEENEIEKRMGTLSVILLTPIPQSTGTLIPPITPPTTLTLAPSPTFAPTGSLIPTSIFPTFIPPTPLPPVSLSRTPYLPTPVIIATRTPTEEPYIPSPAIQLSNQIAFYFDHDSSSSITLNDQLQYQFLVTNTGDTLLNNIMIIDNSFGSSVTCPSTSLAVGASMTCTADSLHTITLSESNGGSVTMLANARGEFKGVVYNDTATINTPISRNPSLHLTKSLAHYDDNDSSGSITQGDSFLYQFVITNSGNVTLTNSRIVDHTFSLPVNCPAVPLNPGSSLTCTATAKHIVSALESTAGNVTNIATASSDFNGVTYTSSDTLTITVSPIVLPNPVISIVKTLASYDDNDASTTITQGDGLWYQFTVTNTGNVPLTNISVTDNTFAIPVSCPFTTLAPANTMVCTANATHSISISESTAGQVSNTATASSEFDSTAYTDSDTLITAVQPAPTAVISGQVREDLDGDGDPGDPDPGLPNVKIELEDMTCTPEVDCPFTLTNASGIFTFTNVSNGSYWLNEYDPAGYTSTGDSDSLNDNKIAVLITGGVDSTTNFFLDHNVTTGCSAPDPINGFIASTNPAHGATNVPLSITTITITYNQPMSTSGGKSVTRIDKYQFENKTQNKKIDILDITYDPVLYRVTLTIDTLDPKWVSNNLYELTIKTVQNSCGDAQSSIIRSFTTE